jgi:hypothetical protein
VRVEVDRRVGSGGVRYYGGAVAAAHARSAGAGRGAPEPPPPPPEARAQFGDALYSNLTVLVARITPPGWEEAQAQAAREKSADGDGGGTDGGAAAASKPAALLLSVHVDTQWTTVVRAARGRTAELRGSAAGTACARLQPVATAR